MKITQNEVKQREEEVRKQIYEIFEKAFQEFATVTVDIKTISSNFDGAIDRNISNVANTAKNKIVELSHVFEQAGISIFVEPNEELGFVDFNFVGEAIIFDIFSKLREAPESLKNYGLELKKVVNTRNEQLNNSFIKKIPLIIKTFFDPNACYKLSDKEVKMLDDALLKYKTIDDEISKYNLKENVSQSLVKYVTERRYSDDSIKGILNKYIIPTLQKLGIEDILPKLEEELSKTSKNDTPWELTPKQIKAINETQQNLGKKYANMPNESGKNINYEKET